MTQFTADATFSYYADEEGNVYATRNGLRRLVGAEINSSHLKTTLRKEDKTFLEAQIPTAGGLQRGKLVDIDIVTEIVNYYADKGHPTAKKTRTEFMKTGGTVFLQHRIGFQQAHPAIKKHFNWLDLREDAILVNQVIMAQGKAVNAFDALNIEYFGMRCRDHKAARFLQEAHRYDNLPDYVDVDELEQLIYLRKQFTRAYGSYPERIKCAVSTTKATFAS
jgi:hypothetical protein